MRWTLTGPHGPRSLPSSRWRRARSPNPEPPNLRRCGYLVPTRVETATQRLLVAHFTVCHIVRAHCVPTSPTEPSERRWAGWGEGASGTSPPSHRGERETQMLSHLPEVTRHRAVKRKGQASNPNWLPTWGLSPTPSLPISWKAHSRLVEVTDTEPKVLRPGCVLAVAAAPSKGTAWHGPGHTVGAQ